MRALLGAVASACLLAFVLAGCSDSGANDEPETTAPPAPEEFFGVVPQTLLTDEDLDRMEQGKVGSLRIVVPWGALASDPKGDEPDFSSIDPVVLGAAQRGIRVLPTVYGTPAWVAEDLDGYDCGDACGTYAPHSPEALAEWKSFIAALVERWGPGGTLWEGHPEVDATPVRTWQIWNEQNSPTFFQPKVDPGAYAALLEASSEAIKERDEDAEIVLGGMFGTPFKGEPPALTAPDFLRQLYAIDGARDNFDDVAAHPYAPRKVKIEQQVTLLRDEIAAADDDAGLWITEVGASSDDGAECTEPCPLERGPEGQAELLSEAFEFFLEQRQEWKIQGVTWYSWRDTSDPTQCDWCPGSGLFPETTLDPKPAWDAFVSFTGGS